MTRGFGGAALAVIALSATACSPARAPSHSGGTSSEITHAPEPGPAPETEAPTPSPAADATLADRDGDGSADAVDACPDVPGAKTADAKTNGCPTGPSLKGCKAILEEVLAFARGSAVIEGDTATYVQRVGESMKRHDEITRVGVEGFAGPKERDRASLSLRRARAVRDALVAQGVDPSRLRLASKPGAQPQPCWTCECDDRVGQVVEVFVHEKEGVPTGQRFTSDVYGKRPAPKVGARPLPVVR